MVENSAEWAGWTVAGMRTLLDAVYWTEQIDDKWTWCVACERLVQTTALVEHLRSEHGSERREN